MYKVPSLEAPTNFNNLLHSCLLGNRQSQKELYLFFAPKVFGICLRYAHDYACAQDILQEGFIKVFRKLDQYQGQGSFEGWIKKIFVYTAIEHYRKQHVQREFEKTYTQNFVVQPKVLEKLAQDDLVAVIQQLPDGYRTVFNLYVIEGYKHPEIAQLLNISEGTSKSQLARARQLLKKQLLQKEYHEATSA